VVVPVIGAGLVRRTVLVTVLLLVPDLVPVLVDVAVRVRVAVLRAVRVRVLVRMLVLVLMRVHASEMAGPECRCNTRAGNGMMEGVRSCSGGAREEAPSGISDAR
jgi:hypothetical protein